MPDPNLPRLLFLSHAGVDTEAARQLKQRLEAASEAREHGLRVWFDKDDLRAGEPSANCLVKPGRRPWQRLCS